MAAIGDAMRYLLCRHYPRRKRVYLLCVSPLLDARSVQTAPRDVRTYERVTDDRLLHEHYLVTEPRRHRSQQSSLSPHLVRCTHHPSKLSEPTTAGDIISPLFRTHTLA